MLYPAIIVKPVPPPDPLSPYNEKRTFDTTPEPPADLAPVAAGGNTLQFCVQRHDASRLHYDLRIEIQGKLESWAVPMGPTLDPNEKRLAVLVEPHPMMYATFEGNIPKGNYGAGSMMLWDLGSYDVLDNTPAEKQMERGDFKFRLHGHKLKGEFALIRLKNSAKGNEWLLIKKKDAAAQPKWNIDAFEWSVASGRTQEEIAHDLPHKTIRHATSPADLTGAVFTGAPPAKLESMLASPGGETMAPNNGEWLFEIKWDGVRAFACIGGGETRFVGRHGSAMNRQYPELMKLHENIRARDAILDGEITTLDEQGRPSFHRLQQRIMVSDAGAAAQYARKQPAVYFAFDLLYLDGYDLRGAPLIERKRLLRLILDPHPSLKFSDHFEVSGEQLFELARTQGLEGILAKRAQSRYTGARSKEWLKYKVNVEQEFLICGYTEGERDFFGGLILGVWNDDGALHCCGTVGGGFDRKSLEAVFNRLQPLRIEVCPFPSMPVLDRPGIWTRPELVCTVRFHSWTEDEGRLRFPVFVGLREDIQPSEARRNLAAPAAIAVKHREPLVAGNKEVTVTIEGQRVTFTNPGKLYYPATSSSEAYVKRDLINYYDAASEFILPYLLDRPLSLRRYPEGIEGEGFFQKHADKGFPAWMRVETILAEDGHERQQIIGGGKAELLLLANMGCIDQNPWMSRVQTLDHPDFILIDLDPHGCGYDKIVEAAHFIRRKLDVLEMTGYPKTTGGDGMHLYIPVEPVYSYEQTKSFCEIIARIVATERPDLFTTPRSVTRRDTGKVYFDYLQNGRGKTISAPYVLRAHPGAPVAAPLEWREVAAGLTPRQFHIRNAMDRFDRLGDLFEGVRTKLQRIEPAMERLPLILPRKS
jgi:bifunctional non-homologous end joining protein LigD